VLQGLDATGVPDFVMTKFHVLPIGHGSFRRGNDLGKVLGFPSGLEDGRSIRELCAFWHRQHGLLVLQGIVERSGEFKMIMRVPDDQFSFALVVLILVILIVSFFRRALEEELDIG